MSHHPTEVRAARIAILDFVDAYAERMGCSPSMAADTIASWAAIGGILPEDIQELVPIANERSNAGRAVSRSTIMSWHKARAEENL